MTVVLTDAWCGEPIAWSQIGDPVIGFEWTEHGDVAVTERLTPAAAVRKYGSITRVVVGPHGGFETATYGDKTFISRLLDPRGTGLYDLSVVVVSDPARDSYECPVCGSSPGEQCVSKRTHKPCSTHSTRSRGRARWEIEAAEAEARRVREEAEAASRWECEMATPPAAGEVLEVKRWKYDDPEYPARPVPDVPERFTVQCTYANRTVRVTGEDGAERFLTRTESNGDWREVCGAPNSQRLPCKGAPGRYCRTKHKAGLTLRENWPWPSP